MTVPPQKTSGGLGAQPTKLTLGERTNGSPARDVGKKLALDWPRQLCRATNRGRLVLFAGLLLLFALGVVGRDEPVIFGATLALATLSAAGQEWAFPKWNQPWLPLTAGVVDGLTAAILIYASGGPNSSLDVLFPVAILALVAQPVPVVALSLAVFDAWLYFLAILAHPAYVPAQHLDLLASRLFLFGLLGIGAYAAIRKRAHWRPEADLEPWCWQGDGRGQADVEEVERVQRSALGRANLIAMLSHDLRTPLTSVKGFAQLLLRDQSASEATQRYAKVILAETNRAIRTIADAVDLARMQCGRGELQLEPVDLRPIFEAAVGALEHHDPEGRIQLNLQGPLPLVRADPSKVERIMVNLISNALRYSQGDSPIEVGAAGDAAGVLVWVQDKGRGIPPEKFAHIFDLETDDSKGECEFNGSGLGLYISKQLVEAHGGHMWVESAEGRGSRFAFRLHS